MAMPIYRIVAYLQASTRTACCLLLGSTINAPHPPLPSSHHQANLSQLFECLFVNFLARKLCCKILCANIVFACFCCAKRQRYDPSPLCIPHTSRHGVLLVLQRKLYQCASVFSGVSLPSFFLYFLLAVVCLLGLLFSVRAFVFDLRSAMYWHFQRLFVSFSLTLLLLVLFSWLPACCVQRATSLPVFFASDFIL